jgi:arabinose-5-phosphate isomerase
VEPLGARSEAVVRGIDAARRALAEAQAAVERVAGRPVGPLEAAIGLVLSRPGRLVVTGLGKSGLVGAKLAATLASTGTPSSFVHAADALHGDAGMVTEADVVLALSNSGETAEVVAFVTLVKDRGVPVIALTGCNGGSTLCRLADVALDAAVSREADPYDLVPSASTTAQVVLGDALAIGLMAARGFGPDDFWAHHPGGALGQRLADLV